MPKRRVGAFLAAAVLLFAVLALGRAWWWGAEPAQILLHAGFVALYVVGPGWLAVRVLRPCPCDLLLELGMGAAFGLATLSLAFLGLHALGLGRWIAAWPLLGAPLALLLRRRGGQPFDLCVQPIRRWHLLALALLGCVVVLRTQVAHPSEWWFRPQLDSMFHAGNAAALARAIEFDNPRMAGVPFHYHVFAYVPYTIERVLLGLPVEALFLRVAVFTLPLVLLLQVFNAGRVLTGSTTAGTLAAAFVVLHVDPGEKLGAWLGPPFALFDSLSYLEFGVYSSPSTCAGLIALATLLVHLHGWLERGARGELAFLALFAFYASGAKGSVMPVVVAALMFAAVVRWRRGVDLRRLLLACAVATAMALPMLLWLARGEESYADAMFHVLPWTALRRTGLLQGAAELFGVAPDRSSDWLVWCLAPFWLGLHLGLAGCLGAAAAWIRRRELGATEWVLAGCAVSGLAAANLVSSPGESQLFFAYNGSIALALLAADALVRRALPRTLERTLLLVLGVPFAAGVAIELANRVREELGRLPPEPAPLVRYRAALAWVRDHVPPDAVLMTSRSEVLISVLAERACFYETEHYTPRWHAAGWSHPGRWGLWRPPDGLVYPLRNAVNRHAFTRADREGFAAARQILGPERPLYVVFDRVRWDPAGGAAGCYVFDATLAWPEIDRHLLRIVFENEAARVCAVVEPGEAR